MKKLIAKIAALLLVGALTIQPEYPDPVPDPDNGSISTLNLNDDETSSKKH